MLGTKVGVVIATRGAELALAGLEVVGAVLLTGAARVGGILQLKCLLDRLRRVVEPAEYSTPPRVGFKFGDAQGQL